VITRLLGSYLELELLYINPSPLPTPDKLNCIADPVPIA